jgi:cell division protease FtsH
MTRSELEDQLTVMMGGRVAEELIYHGEVSTGASDDLERASELARQMVTRFGMSPGLGNLTYGRSFRGRFIPGQLGEERNYSERTAQQIDDEVHRLSKAGYEQAKAILTSRREDLEKLARELMTRETVDRARLDSLLGSTVPT